MPVVARSPVMVPSPQARRGLAVVRRRRLLVEQGSLVLVHEDGRREVLAAPGEVVAAWWTPVAAAVGLGVPKAMTSATVTDVVVVQRREGSPLVLRLADWLPASRRTPFDVVTGAEVAGWPGPPEEPSLSAAVRLSGAAALVAALGVEFGSAAGGERLERLRTLLGRGRREVRGVVDIPGPLLWSAVATVSAVVGLMALPVFGLVRADRTLVIVEVVGLLGTALVLARTVLQVLASRERDAVQLPEPVWRPTPTVPTSRRFVERALVSAGPEWLVVRDQHDREGWTPGPAQGGATTVRVTWPWLTFHDDADVPLWRLKTDEWLTEPELSGWLEQLQAAGYAVVGDAPVGPNDTAWLGVPVFPGLGRPQEPLGVFGMWADSGYGICALTFALQLRFMQDGGGPFALDPSPLLTVPPGLAVAAGVFELVRARRDNKVLLIAQPPVRTAARQRGSVRRSDT